jgi:hypothetical protein
MNYEIKSFFFSLQFSICYKVLKPEGKIYRLEVEQHEFHCKIVEKN